MQPVEHRLLTDKEAPEVVGVKRKTLQEWRRQQKGPTFIRVSNRIFYKLSDLLAFRENCPRTAGIRHRDEK